MEYFRKALSPDDLKQELIEKYGKMKMEVIKGDEEWLPEADWPKMKVHRIQADIKLIDSGSGAGRCRGGFTLTAT